ncbi:hypothetical protein B0H19DRAFT_1267021 [Mycena capillaripes]|nr:hypothetical protein B0H19DRAFT_1267021 [Mycena capillaripes]
MREQGPLYWVRWCSPLHRASLLSLPSARPRVPGVQTHPPRPPPRAAPTSTRLPPYARLLPRAIDDDLARLTPRSARPPLCWARVPMLLVYNRILHVHHRCRPPKTSPTRPVCLRASTGTLFRLRALATSRTRGMMSRSPTPRVSTRCAFTSPRPFPHREDRHISSPGLLSPHLRIVCDRAPRPPLEYVRPEYQPVPPKRPTRGFSTTQKHAAPSLPAQEAQPRARAPASPRHDTKSSRSLPRSGENAHAHLVGGVPKQKHSLLTRRDGDGRITQRRAYETAPPEIRATRRAGGG